MSTRTSDDSGCAAGPQTQAVRIGLTVGVLCLVVQALAANFAVKAFHSPNFASRIAQNLAARGVYAGGEWWRLRGTDAPIGHPELRAFHLPGEPLYLAAAFRWLPEWSHRYLHVPVTACLVGCVAAATALLFGPATGLLAGAFATLQPFVVQHGPVWDDTFLGAALEWLILALLLMTNHRAGTLQRSTLSMAIAALAAWAALVRSQSQAVLLALAIAIVALPSLRPRWRQAAAIVLGMAIALAGWACRNQMVLGSFLLGSTHDGITLWESNYPSAVEALLERGQVERLNAERMTDDFEKTAAMGELEADRYFRNRAVAHIKNHPLEIAEAAAVKLWIAAIGIRPEERWTHPRNLVAFGSNLLLATLTLAGGVRLMSAKPMPPGTFDLDGSRQIFWIYVALTVLATLGLTCIGPVGMRYRIGMDACCWIASGVALSAGWVRLTQPRPRRACDSATASLPANFATQR